MLTFSVKKVLEKVSKCAIIAKDGGLPGSHSLCNSYPSRIKRIFLLHTLRGECVMKKKIAALFAVFALGATLSACGTGFQKFESWGVTDNNCSGTGGIHSESFCSRYVKG